MALLAALLALALVPARVWADAPLARPNVDRLVEPLIEGGWLYGVAIGVVDERGRAVFGYGRISETVSHPPVGDTVFELASVTKVFTGLVLAQMVQQDEVRLDTPASVLLPPGVSLPKHGTREITLVDLATHTSALPRIPQNLKPADEANPYADYTTEQLYDFLSHATLPRAPGTMSDYSNLGVGLLGHVLALRTGQSYEDLVSARVCRPLGMTSTRVNLNDSMRSRLAEPHDADGNPVKNWDVPTLTGAGGLRSTVDDMLQFLAAELGLNHSRLDAAVKLSQQVHFDPHDGATAVGLAWQINTRDGILWHNGQTGGYHTYVAILPAKRVGVVVLANTATMRAVDQLGAALLAQATGGRAEPLALPTPIELDEAAQKDFVGTYTAGALTVMIVRQDERGLTARFAGQPTQRLLAEGPTKFFCRAADIEVTFERNDQGEVAGAALKILGQPIQAVKKK
jgi:CubicO group peptidase (beta-lactamase class C family)